MATKPPTQLVIRSCCKRHAVISVYLAHKTSSKKTKKKPQQKKTFLVLDYFKSFFVLFTEFPIHTTLALLISAGIFGTTYYLHEAVFKDLPLPQELTQRPPVVSSKILDRNGHVLFRVYENENRTIIPLSQMPASLIQATIAIEDKDFYNHHGFSVRGIARALFTNSQENTLQGGSTLTQQLVKNRLLSSEKTFKRKIRELILAILVEGTYTKHEILEMYLNQVPYGGSTYGIEEAAQKYFGKSAQYLTLAESALLAGIPQAPTRYSPFGVNPELAYQRQQDVLRRMVEDGYITQQQAEDAHNQKLVFSKNSIEIEAPHFVMYVKELLAATYGEEMLENGGLSITTTLDLPTQHFAQEAVTSEVDKLRALRVSNGAALVTNPQSGEILAMVGSRDYFDFANDGQVNVTTRQRQPGSSIKPLTYALALEKGESPVTVIDDAPITYNIAGSEPYSPKNYDGKFHGKVTIREALASSYNIPAVKMLANITVPYFLQRASDFGISTWKDTNRFGLSITLGGGEILMTEMAQLYGTFSNQGTLVPLNPILEVKTYDGKILYQNQCALHGTCDKKSVIDPIIAYQITSILSDNTARTPAFGEHSTLTIPGQEVAVKTGTTNNLRDNWTIGYTSNRVVAVWVGNNNNTPMSYVASGITGASPIWNHIMRAMVTETAPHQFERPSGIKLAEVCVRTSLGIRKYTDFFTQSTQVNSNCPSFEQNNGIQNQLQSLPALPALQQPNYRTRQNR